MKAQPVSFVPSWSAPDPRYLRPSLPDPPPLPLDDVVSHGLCTSVGMVARAKGAPADYVFFSLLSVVGSLIGNTRWVAPQASWAEPPLIWTMLIGLPSAGKSPAIDGVLRPLENQERSLRKSAEADRNEWSTRKEIAEIAEREWKDRVKRTITTDEPPPPKPENAILEPEPFLPRLKVNDGTIERLAVILGNQPWSLLCIRDELAGWIAGMSRYNHSSDRPFWIEAYGGRSYTVERLSRDPLTVKRLSIGILGGIQPDRLDSLLFKTDDDGLLSRLLPIWPNPAPIQRQCDEDNSGDRYIEHIVNRLSSLQIVAGDDGDLQPILVPFSGAAREVMYEFRCEVRRWEKSSEGLILSFLGKMPGLAGRLSLILAYMDWAEESGPEPAEISDLHFARAVDLIETYIVPMAKRAYRLNSLPRVERSAQILVGILNEKGWKEFSSRDVLRLGRAGLASKKDLDPVLDALIEGDCIRNIEPDTVPEGGRPQRKFEVNPAILEL